METSFEEVNNVLIVSLKGRFVAAVASDVRDQISLRVERMPNVILDLSEMTHIDSSGLGCFVQLLQRSNTRGGTLVLASLQAHPRIVFDITKVYKVFKIFNSVKEALESFR